VLVKSDLEFEEIPIGVFSELNLAGIVLLEVCDEIVHSRLTERQGRPPAFDVSALRKAERLHATTIASQLAIPLSILEEQHEVSLLAALRRWI
jgi:adenylate kinase